jgi:hypothetical protein
MLAPVDPARRASRAEAIRLAEFYPAGLEIGSFVTVSAPFAKDAYRFENGRLMAGLTYRVIAVDEELGITLLRMPVEPSGWDTDVKRPKH